MIGKIILLAVILHELCKQVSASGLICLALLLYSFEIIAVIAKFIVELKSYNKFAREQAEEEKSYWSTYRAHWNQFEDIGAS